MPGNKNDKAPTLLFVEDETDISSIYKMRLEMEGFDVTVCEDGESAVESAKNLQPDMILLDLMLPKMDGFTVLKKLRRMAETKQARIVIISAIGEKPGIDRAMDLGADSYIVKSQRSIDDIMEHLWGVLRAPLNQKSQDARS